MKSRITLKSYLSLHFGAVAMLPVIIIFLLVWFLMMPAIQTRTEIQHQAMARTIAGHISSYLEGGARQLTALAEFLRNQAPDIDPTAVDLLDAQCGDGGFFEAVFVINTEDDVVKAVGLTKSRRPNRIDYMGLDFSGRGIARILNTHNKAVWSPPFLSTISSRMAVALGLPMDNGSIIGEIPLGNLAEFISLLPVESEFLTLVIDSHGLIVADSQRRRAGQVLNISYSTAKDSGMQPASQAFFLDGVKMVGAWVEMEAVGWTVLFAQPATKAFQPLRDTLVLIGLGLAIALGLALSIAWFLAGNLTVLFRDYTGRAESLANGHYDLQWPVARTKEFFKLSQSLQRMAEKINQREKALTDSEARLRDLVANVPGLVYQYKADPKALESSSLTTVVQERSIEIFGLDVEEDAFFSGLVCCLPPEDQPRFVKSVKVALETAAPWYYEGRFIKPTGEKIWFEGRSVPRWIDGELIYYGVLMDVTRRKEMESSLRLAQFIIDNANVGIYRIDPDGRIREVNQKAAELLGYTKEELETLTMADIDTVVARQSWRSNWRKLTDQGMRNLEAQHRKKDGSVFPVEVHSNLLDYEGQQYAVAFVQNITERKQAEEALRRLQNYLSNIIDSMPSILVAVDLDGNVTQWNSQAQQATGLGVADARRQPLATVFPRLAGEIERIRDSIRERRVISAPKVSCELDNETRFEDITIFPLVANGVEGAVIRVDDVTQQVRLEEMMIQSEKMLSVGGLAAGMAHEINNPLAGILQNVLVLKNRLLGDLPANHKAAEAAGTTLTAIQKYLALRKLPVMIEAIRSSGSLAAAIVKNMLSFARKSEKVVSNQDLGTLLDQSIDLLKTDYDMRKHYDFKRVEIVRQYDAAVQPVPCESSKIQQVLMNILKNGAEAMAEVTDASDPPTFILRVQDDGAWVRVEIEDNGPGIDEKTRRRIFEPFYTTKPVGKGTGLGLSVSYFIITEDHGGEMAVRSAAKGGGACFVIRLPKGGGDR